MASKRSVPRHQLIDEMLRDQQELRELITKVHRVLADRQESIGRVTQLMREVLERIQTHFADEEASGLFEQIAEHSPELGPLAAELRAQHDEISRMARELVAQASQGEAQTVWWDALARGFHEFSRSMIHHENLENTMVMDAYECDHGTGD